MPWHDTNMSHPQTPAQAWAELDDGNARFVAGRNQQPGQDPSGPGPDAPPPFALVLTCTDPVVDPEILFGRGLGDLAVVRTAGQVLDSVGLASVEFGVAGHGVRLVVVLGHEGCAVVRAVLDVLRAGEIPRTRLRALVEGITPSVTAVRRTMSSLDGVDPDAVAFQHVRRTSRMLLEWSPILAERVAEGECAVVGAMLRSDTPAVRIVEAVGAVDPAGPTG
jgi:carbonic anhydrase